MIWTVRIACVCALVSMGACDRARSGEQPAGEPVADEVEDAIEDLEEARTNVGTEVQRLEKDLSDAKARVVELEKKLALANQGVTDEVLQERRELAEALRDNRADVQEEVSEAQAEAQSHNAATRKALDLLRQTEPPQVEADVQSSSEVQAPADEVTAEEQQKVITVERVRGIDTGETEDEKQEPGAEQQPPQDDPRQQPGERGEP